MLNNQMVSVPGLWGFGTNSSATNLVNHAYADCYWSLQFGL